MEMPQKRLWIKPSRKGDRRLICRYCDKVIIHYERITVENQSGLKRVFHSDCFFKSIGKKIV